MMIKLKTINDNYVLINPSTVTFITDLKDKRVIYCDAGMFNNIEVFETLDELEEIFNKG